jgi:chemotaxis methyl-accepting protein methylase
LGHAGCLVSCCSAIARGYRRSSASGDRPVELPHASRFVDVRPEILATDADPMILERPRDASYGAGSLRELPAPWRERGFMRHGDRYVLRAEQQRLVTVRHHDLRAGAPTAV